MEDEEDGGMLSNRDVALESKFSDPFIVAALSSFEQGKFEQDFYHAAFLLHGEFKCDKICFSTDKKVLKVTIPDPRGERKKGARHREENKNISSFTLLIEKKNILQACYRALSLLMHNLYLCKTCGHMAMRTTQHERENFKLVMPPCVLEENCFCYLYMMGDETSCSRCTQYRVVNMGPEEKCVICMENFNGQMSVHLGKGCAQCKTMICSTCIVDKNLPKTWKIQCQTCKKDFYS